MSYRISYTIKGTHRKEYRCISISPVLGIGVMFVLVLVVGFFALSNDIDHALRMLFPWTEAFTVSAIQKLEASIQQGTPIMDAVTVFCREIIGGVPI